MGPRAVDLRRSTPTKPLPSPTGPQDRDGLAKGSDGGHTKLPRNRLAAPCAVVQLEAGLCWAAAATRMLASAGGWTFSSFLELISCGRAYIAELFPKPSPYQKQSKSGRGTEKHLKTLAPLPNGCPIVCTPRAEINYPLPRPQEHDCRPPLCPPAKPSAHLPSTATGFEAVRDARVVLPREAFTVFGAGVARGAETGLGSVLGGGCVAAAWALAPPGLAWGSAALAWLCMVLAGAAGAGAGAGATGYAMAGPDARSGDATARSVALGRRMFATGIGGTAATVGAAEVAGGSARLGPAGLAGERGAARWAAALGAGG